MSPRQFFRAVGWLVSELIPAQFVDAMLSRDFGQFDEGGE